MSWPASCPSRGDGSGASGGCSCAFVPASGGWLSDGGAGAGLGFAVGLSDGFPDLGANLHLPGRRVCSRSPPCLHFGHDHKLMVSTVMEKHGADE